jgi:hypothetical protein
MNSKEGCILEIQAKFKPGEIVSSSLFWNETHDQSDFRYHLRLDAVNEETGESMLKKNIEKVVDNLMDNYTLKEKFKEFLGELRVERLMWITGSNKVTLIEKNKQLVVSKERMREVQLKTKEREHTEQEKVYLWKQMIDNLKWMKLEFMSKKWEILKQKWDEMTRAREKESMEKECAKFMTISIVQNTIIRIISRQLEIKRKEWFDFYLWKFSA